MKTHTLLKETIVNGPIEKVFDFFSKAGNLNKLTPPDLKFSIVTPLPITMGRGTLIDYKLKLNGIPFGWRTEITDWNPPFQFEDTQVKGPYRVWIHQHHFEPRGDKTLMTDKLTFLAPGYLFEPLINVLFVQKKVEKIFTYRGEKLKELFG